MRASVNTDLRRSATEAQLGSEFGNVLRMEFEFKLESAFAVALNLELELATSSSTHLPTFLSSAKETTATCEKHSLSSIFISILFEHHLSGTQNGSQNDPLGDPNGTPLGISDLGR